MSTGLNAAVVESLNKNQWADEGDEVWEETQTESSRSWTSPAETRQPKFLAKRFGLVQKNKIRMIDDFTCCGRNSAYGLTEKLRVQLVDELCSYLFMLVDNDAFEKGDSIVGRTFDLKSAYEQFEVCF